MIPVYPKFRLSNAYSSWNYSLLMIFLNEMHDFIPKHHGFEEKDDGICFHFTKLDNDQSNLTQTDAQDEENVENSNLNDNITKKDYSISVFLGSTIIVKLSSDFLIIDISFIKEFTRFPSTIGSELKQLKKPRFQLHIRFSRKFEVFSNTSKNFFYKQSLIYNSRFDYSQIFNYFSKHIDVRKLPINDDTQMLVKNYVESHYTSNA